MGNLSGESREQNRKDKVTRFRSVTYARQLGLLVNTLGSHLKVMLHETIRNDDFQRKIQLQCWNSVVTIRNNVATMLRRCVALKIVVANRLV